MIPQFEISLHDIRSYFSKTIFNRGAAYYRNGRVKIVEFDGRRFIARVRGTKLYTVTLEMTDEGWAMGCDCPCWYGCKHMVAALLQARDYIEEANKMPESMSEPAWKKQFAALLQNRSKDFFTDQPPWVVGFVISTSVWSWQISAKKFFQKKDGALGRCESLDVWSLSSVRGGPSAFRALDILRKLEEPSQQSSYYRSSYEATLKYGQDVGPLLTSIQESPVCTLNRGIPSRIKFSETECAVQFHYDESDDSYALTAKIVLSGYEQQDLKDFYLLSRKPAYILHRQTLYKVDNTDDAELLLPFLNSTTSISIPKKEFTDFITTTYPKLRQRSEVPLPSSMEQSVISAFNGKRIVLEEEPEQLRIRMQFQYGDHAINLEDDRPTIVDLTDNRVTIIRRDLPTEKQAADAMKETHARKMPEGGWRVLDSRAMNWLFKHIPALLQQGFDIVGRETLTKYKVRTSIPRISVGISSDIDWFDIQLEISIEGIQLSMKELKKALRNKERYVKLVDNSFAQLPEDWFARFQHLFHFATVEEEVIRASSRHALLLDELFQDAADMQTDDGFRQNLERLQAFDRIKEQPLPAGLVGTLRPYQRKGYDWLCFLRDYRLGGCLADDMGLGKTIQALTLLQHEKEAGVRTPSLVVCPTSVVYNWQLEATKFAPELRTRIHTGVGRDKSGEAFAEVDLVLTTYGIMMRDAELLRATTFHYLILDESQKIKNPHSQSAYVACHLNASHRLVLTGTPVENNTLELWSQFQFINPGLLGTLPYFRQGFAAQIEKYKNQETARLLRRMIYPFILRRSKEMVAAELPTKSEQTLLCDLSAGQRKAYEAWRDVYRAKLLKLIDEQGVDKSRMNVLQGLTRLRQIANHPALIDPEMQEDSGKFEVLFDLVEDIIQEGHKLLLFSQFVKMLTLVRQRFDVLGIPYEYLDGSTQKRQERVDNFQTNDEVRAFLISLRAGGTGLNLTAADYVIHVDPWWNPAVEMQATDRAHRIGQDKKVFVYKLITKDTVEEKIVQLQERKKKLVADLVTTESGFFKSLDRDDIEVLFS
ncbi:SNF2 helicase associated domain-containing protein [candidate division KSB1 bacterium]|nr:SNF2 helicase associated domain-containing protein [candidate division KSB1 bacterium]RQW08118.1 MAG: serine/threonine protein kinase [candidate division KSB1 bacterium]